MEDKNSSTDIKNLLISAKSVVIILPPDPGKDLVAAGVSLHLSLKESGKVSQIGCGTEVHVNDSIEGVSDISDTIGSRNLIISFDYQEEDLDRVDYDVRDDGKFYLSVKPKTGSPVPDIGNVKYSYSGASADLVIVLGVKSLEELGKIYADEKNYLDNADIISLNNSLHPSSFTGHLYHQGLRSLSELVSQFIEENDLKTNSILAQNLLDQIYESSNGLADSRLTADTFTTIAFLMRSGAKLPQNQIKTTPLSEPPFFEIKNQETEEDQIPLPEESDAPIPSDWNKPKIFRVGDNQLK